MSSHKWGISLRKVMIDIFLDSVTTLYMTCSFSEPVKMRTFKLCMIIISIGLFSADVTELQGHRSI